MRALLAAVFALAACDVAWDVPGAIVTAQGSGERLSFPEWSVEVERAVADWNATLVNLGCLMPFEIGSDGYPVRLVRVDRWRYGDYTMGIIHDDEIEIREIDMRPNATPAYQRILLHELGHAIGLGHQGDGIMARFPRGEVIDAEVANAAAIEIGCR